MKTDVNWGVLFCHTINLFLKFAVMQYNFFPLKKDTLPLATDIEKQPMAGLNLRFTINNPSLSCHVTVWNAYIHFQL